MCRDSRIAWNMIRFGDVHRDGSEPRLAAGSAAAGELPRRERPVAEADLGQFEQAAARYGGDAQSPAQGRNRDRHGAWGTGDRARLAAWPCGGGAGDNPQDCAGPLDPEYGEGRGLAAPMRSGGGDDGRSVDCAALQARLCARGGRGDGDVEPGRDTGPRQGEGARSLRGVGLAPGAAGADRERLGTETSREWRAGALRRELVLLRGPPLSARAVWPQPRPPR